MNSDFEIKNEKTPMAPTVSIEQISIVRPIKVIALLCAMGGVFFGGLSVAGTTWFESKDKRAGLWEACVYLPNQEEAVIECKTAPSSDWLQTCQVFAVFSLVVCFLALLVTSAGLTTDLYHRKYKYYIIGMILMVIAAGAELTALIIYPVKYSETIFQAHVSWSMGWAYGLGWVAAILMTTGSVIIYIDKGADELIYREKTEYGDSIEEDCA